MFLGAALVERGSVVLLIPFGRPPLLLISRLHSCVVFLLRLYLTLLPQAQEPVPQAPALQGNQSEPRLAPPRHGTFTPGRISVGRPPCVIPVSPGLGLDGSIIVPGGIIAKQPATGCFVDGWTRWHPIGRR